VLGKLLQQLRRAASAAGAAGNLAKNEWRFGDDLHIRPHAQRRLSGCS